MTAWQGIGLCGVWLLCVGLVAQSIASEYRRHGFSFHGVFSLAYLVTFYGGFPFTAILAFHFNVQPVGAEALLQALLAAAAFYAVYLAGYRIWRPSANGSAHAFSVGMNRAEALLTAGLLGAVAVMTAAVFFANNGFLLFRLHSYSQIFSRDVSGVALKRFFYFFLPAMLVWFFLYQTQRAWLAFLLTTATFGALTYLIVGGTRANLMMALTLFVCIGVARGWIALRWIAVVGLASVALMFWLALRRYGLNVHGEQAFYTFLYLTRDSFSPWENLALLCQRYEQIVLQGLAPIARDFYVFIPAWLWPERPAQILNSANYFTWEVLNYHAGLAMSPTLLGSLLVMVGWWGLLPGAILVGWIIKGFDVLYQQGCRTTNRALAAVIRAFCFGALFNLIVLVREGLDAFVSRMVFFSLVFIASVLIAKGLYRLLVRAGVITDAPSTGVGE
ncbi:ECA oligosaccharide polymerase [Musicola keenii]|uniref:ECA oligosaccharide polymerase n=1 Tax=Musicola keenii TaxID=2884250 RepID=UPI001783EBF2|nr:ECA oligosaccharide polymerase [Musicola keenii]